MSKIEQIRHQVMQGKRRSIFNIHPLPELPKDFLPHDKKDRNATVDSESNFSLFPLISLSDDSAQRKWPCNGNAEEGQKVQLRPFLKEKRQKKGEESWRESVNRGRGDTVENVSSLMARSFVPSARINRTLHTQRIAAHTERVMCVQSRDAKHPFPKQKPRRSPSKSPNKRRRLIRTRRTISPRRLVSPTQHLPSPTRKFSISAWEIPTDEGEF